MTNTELRERMESIIHAYAVSHCRAGSVWQERRRVRNIALDDLSTLIDEAVREARVETARYILNVFPEDTVLKRLTTKPEREVRRWYVYEASNIIAANQPKK